MLKIIPFYAAILALLYVCLSARTIGFRRKSRVSIGDGGDQELLRAIRMHANFAEYVPFWRCKQDRGCSYIHLGDCYY